MAVATAAGRAGKAAGRQERKVAGNRRRRRRARGCSQVGLQALDAFSELMQARSRCACIARALMHKPLPKPTPPAVVHPSTPGKHAGHPGAPRHGPPGPALAACERRPACSPRLRSQDGRWPQAVHRGNHVSVCCPALGRRRRPSGFTGCSAYPAAPGPAAARPNLGKTASSRWRGAAAA